MLTLPVAGDEPVICISQLLLFTAYFLSSADSVPPSVSLFPVYLHFSKWLLFRPIRYCHPHNLYPLPVEYCNKSSTASSTGGLTLALIGLIAVPSKGGVSRTLLLDAAKKRIPAYLFLGISLTASEYIS